MAKESSSKETQPAAREPAPMGRWPSPFDEMDRLMDRLRDREWMRPLWGRWSALEPQLPKVDVIERDKEVLVRAEVPGMKREDLDVSVSDSTVTIKGQSRRESETEEGDYYRCEITRGAFARTLALPSEVDADKVQAKFADGILEVTLPKVKQARRRKVEVK